jgi:diguanylate cyclase (GGDEF)-like protein/PAS domain S-box-containing protein
MFGRTADELLGCRIDDLAHPEDHGDSFLVREKLLSRTEKHHVREKRYIHADGHTIWAEVAVSLVTAPDGRPSHFVGQIQDITERRALVQQLRQMADHDPLTGLLNRRAFGRELEAHLTRGQRYGASGALLMFDLDNFKLHNDTQGHTAGDELLVALADGLRRRLRASDVTARLGGDEFAVLLPNSDTAHARLVSESLRDHIRTIAAGVTASIGVVSLDRLQSLTPEAALRAADDALYGAKRAGRDRVAEWTPKADSVIPASD